MVRIRPKRLKRKSSERLNTNWSEVESHTLTVENRMKSFFRSVDCCRWKSNAAMEIEKQIQPPLESYRRRKRRLMIHQLERQWMASGCRAIAAGLLTRAATRRWFELIEVTAMISNLVTNNLVNSGELLNNFEFRNSNESLLIGRCCARNFRADDV